MDSLRDERFSLEEGPFKAVTEHIYAEFRSIRAPSILPHPPSEAAGLSARTSLVSATPRGSLSARRMPSRRGTDADPRVPRLSVLDVARRRSSVLAALRDEALAQRSAKQFEADARRDIIIRRRSMQLWGVWATLVHTVIFPLRLRKHRERFYILKIFAMRVIPRINIFRRRRRKRLHVEDLKGMYARPLVNDVIGVGPFAAFAENFVSAMVRRMHPQYFVPGESVQYAGVRSLGVHRVAYGTAHRRRGGRTHSSVSYFNIVGEEMFTGELCAYDVIAGEEGLFTYCLSEGDLTFLARTMPALQDILFTQSQRISSAKAPPPQLLSGGLRSYPIWSALEEATVESVVDEFKFRSYPPGSVVCREGQKADVAFIVIRGKVEVSSSIHGVGASVALATLLRRCGTDIQHQSSRVTAESLFRIAEQVKHADGSHFEILMSWTTSFMVGFCNMIAGNPQEVTVTATTHTDVAVIPRGPIVRRLLVDEVQYMLTRRLVTQSGLQYIPWMILHRYASHRPTMNVSRRAVIAVPADAVVIIVAGYVERHRSGHYRTAPSEAEEDEILRQSSAGTMFPPVHIVLFTHEAMSLMVHSTTASYAKIPRGEVLTILRDIDAEGHARVSGLSRQLFQMVRHEAHPQMVDVVETKAPPTHHLSRSPSALQSSASSIEGRGTRQSSVAWTDA